MVGEGFVGGDDVLAGAGRAGHRAEIVEGLGERPAQVGGHCCSKFLPLAPAQQFDESLDGVINGAAGLDVAHAPNSFLDKAGQVGAVGPFFAPVGRGPLLIPEMDDDIGEDKDRQDGGGTGGDAAAAALAAREISSSVNSRLSAASSPIVPTTSPRTTSGRINSEITLTCRIRS